MLRSALRSDGAKLGPEDEETEESTEAADDVRKVELGSAPEPPELSSDSEASSRSSDLRLLCTDRLGMVNCGMLPGVRMFGKRFSRLV